jgi:hypothetical protein
MFGATSGAIIAALARARNSRRGTGVLIMRAERSVRARHREYAWEQRQQGYGDEHRKDDRANRS